MTLTTALALLGAAVLLALALHGWWSLRRARVRRPLGGSDATGGRIEPALHRPAAAASPESAGPGAPIVPSAPRPVPWSELRLDPLIDAIVPVVPEAVVSGEAVLAHLPATRRAGSKPFYVEGLEVGSGAWEPVAAGGRYRELQAGVQLASRSGPLNEIEYSEFVQKIEHLAEAIDARAEPPDMLEVAARARELDGLTSPIDATLTITLRANTVAWSVAYLQQVVARHGLVSGAVPGRMVLPAAEEGAPPSLVLSVAAQAALADDPAASAVRECVLTLDVPQTPEAAEPFPAFHRVATALADDLDATAVDDQGQPITLHAYDAIGKEIAQLYRALERLDLAAGSPAARRLFS